MEKQSSPWSSPPPSGDLAARESMPSPGNMPLGVVSTVSPELRSKGFRMGSGTQQRRPVEAEEEELLVSPVQATNSSGGRRRRL
jgi:hypothetical protein